MSDAMKKATHTLADNVKVWKNLVLKNFTLRINEKTMPKFFTAA